MMREKELRLALICYGGISLAVYMHGITKEIWHLARASRDFHENAPITPDSRGVYHQLLALMKAQGNVKMRILPDIIAGASAGGINGIFLAQAIATGQSLDPLTDLWLSCADVDSLLDPDARPLSKFSKAWAVPLVWLAAKKPGGTVERTVDPETRNEVRRKLSSFIRARWFEPPFGGAGFTHLLLNAFDAMATSENGPELLPKDQPLDLFVTVTDFHGHPERLRLNSPPEVVETEHRLVLSFSNRRADIRGLGESAELVFAARATASFPGAFPPFTIAELDGVLRDRDQKWSGRSSFLSRSLPRQTAAGNAETTVLIDGSVLANAPFAPALGALKNRPARREVDRRFVYIDPKPGLPAIGMKKGENDALPGFFGTIFGALSNLPRSQPIRDNLEAIDGRSSNIRRMQTIIEAVRPEVEASIENVFGMTLFLDRPTPARLSAWRAKAQDKAAKNAGHAYVAYAHVKLSAVVEELADTIFVLSGKNGAVAHENLRTAIWSVIRNDGIDQVCIKGNGASKAVIAFFRNHDLGFRIRRLRFLLRRLTDLVAVDEPARIALDTLRTAMYECLAYYLDREIQDFYGPDICALAQKADQDPRAAIDALADARLLRTIDRQTDERLAEALAALPKTERRIMLLTYLGFPYYDIATLPLLQGEGTDEFDPVKVDRISPDDACAIRSGGAEATLKGIQFNSFGAFFSRSYRENDYLWGRLHGADRLIDIIASSLPSGQSFSPGQISTLKHDVFIAILDEEEPRLTAISDLFNTLRQELGATALGKAGG